MHDFTFSIVLNIHSTAAFWTGDNGSLKCDIIKRSLSYLEWTVAVYSMC